MTKWSVLKYLQRSFHRRPTGECLFQKVFEQCPVGMFVLERDGRILNANRPLCVMLGYSEGGLQGRSLSELTHPEDTNDCLRMFERLFSGEIEVLRLEKRWMRRDGSWFWGRVNAGLIQEGRGATLKAAGVAEDIGLRKEVEAELRRSNADLDLYASIASHDLQEPVRKIITYGHMLAKVKDRLPEEGKMALSKIQCSAKRMQELIEDLLEYARVNAAERASAPVDLNAVLREVLADLELAIKASSARVQAAELPVVEADALQMRLLLQNLISNALKFVAPGQAPDIGIRAEGLEGGEVRLEVRDQGIGFDEKFLDRIFKPFQRLCDKNLYEGSGIGLAICKRVAQRHGGSITARSAPGKGACFRITLPVVRRDKCPSK